jgi:hypothetical protein
MSKPDPVLLSIARGESAGAVDIPRTEALFHSAVEHRMTGLLFSASIRGDVSLPPALTERLVEWDMSGWARHAMLVEGLRQAATRLDVAGVQWVVFKGPVSESLLFERQGERPYFDLDLAVAPGHVQHIDEIVALLEPRHRDLGRLGILCRSGHFQAVSLALDGDGAPIDLHCDPMSLGVPTPRIEWLWEEISRQDVGIGFEVPVLSPEGRLLHALVNITRDRFRHLLGHVEVFRHATRPGLDQRRVEELASQLHLEVIAGLAWSAVQQTLGQGTRLAFRDPGALDRLLWEWTWGERSRLGGVESKVRRVQRSRAILPLLAVGPTRTWWRWMVGRPFPPREVVQVLHGDGAYLPTLARGRLRYWNARWRSRRGRRELQ